MPRATSLMGVPTFYTRLLAASRPDARGDRPYAPVRLGLGAAARRDPRATFEARTGHAILERYGMTETNMNTSNPYDGDRVAGTVGFPLARRRAAHRRPGDRRGARRRARSA